MELLEFANQLNLGRVKELTCYTNGQHNEIYKLVTDNGEFSLRIYNYKKPSQILFELSLLQHLHRLKVPHPVKLTNGYIEKYNGKYVIVYHYIPGEQLTTFTNEQLNQVGKFLGEFHNLGSSFKWDKYRYKFYNLPDWKIEKFTKILVDARLKHLELLPEIIKELKENRLSSKLPTGPIHVDVKPENVLFNYGKLNGVLDFDNSYIGPFLLDIGKTMAWFGLDSGKFNIRNARQILIGYVSVRKLSDLELAEIKKALRFAFLSHIFVDYYMRAIEATTERYFEFIVNEFYAAYKSLTRDFYSIGRDITPQFSDSK